MAVGDPCRGRGEDGTEDDSDGAPADEAVGNVAAGVPACPSAPAARPASAPESAGSITRIRRAEPTSGAVGVDADDASDCSTGFSRSPCAAGGLAADAAGTGADSVVARGLGQPQGIAFDTQGNLLVSDTGHHRLVRITLR